MNFTNNKEYDEWKYMCWMNIKMDDYSIPSSFQVRACRSTHQNSNNGRLLVPLPESRTVPVISEDCSQSFCVFSIVTPEL